MSITKLLPLAALAAAVLTCCQTADSGKGPVTAPADSCGFVVPRDDGPKRAWAENRYKWTPAQTVTKKKVNGRTVFLVAFKDGSAHNQARFLNYANEYASGGARIIFKKVSWGKKADMKVTLHGNGHWSYLGNSARGFGNKTITLSVAVSPDGMNLMRVARHEVGHFLGLSHEHQSPVGGISWNAEQVYADALEWYGWGKEAVDYNILNISNSTNYSTTGFDPESVMLYWFPSTWTTDGFETGYNIEISAADKELVRRLYP